MQGTGNRTARDHANGYLSKEKLHCGIADWNSLKKPDTVPPCLLKSF